MYKCTIQRRFMTLIEIMIVMFLIALITGVIAYNYRGSLDEGKVFKTKTAIEKVEAILNLQAAKDPEFTNNVQSKWKETIANSPLVRDPKSLIYDGWGEEYQVNADENGVIHVESKKYNEYKRTHQSLFNN
ncbi:MAG: hypothetical protein WCF65_00330 [Parachlamydiaceae bacterium]